MACFFGSVAGLPNHRSRWIFFAGGVLGCHLFERRQQQLADHKIAIPFFIRRHDVPRSKISAAILQCSSVCVLIVVPFFAFFQIARIKLPVLLRQIDSLLQPCSLRILADVKKALLQRNSVTLSTQNTARIRTLLPRQTSF